MSDGLDLIPAELNTSVSEPQFLPMKGRLSSIFLLGCKDSVYFMVKVKEKKISFCDCYL